MSWFYNTLDAKIRKYAKSRAHLYGFDFCLVVLKEKKIQKLAKKKD